ncbi:MAG: protein kinase [Vicinamibacteria bacterium]|nr:protein kinase [Vicinamibacteria bacterium]
MECPSCKTPLPEKARFCLDCGAKAPDVLKSEPEDPIRAALRKALGQQYEIQRLLGKGGMGAVYLATEAALEREVAIKVLPPDRGATKDSRDRFRREARTAAKLSHPNIVPLYTFGDVDGTLYFVMGYVKGESLAARLKREGRIPVEESRRILIEIAEALDYAHKLGVIHRDIKPDNVLLEEGTGRTLLTDFGIAKAFGAGQTMTEVGSVLGTPQYMSPEQAQGKSDIDHRSDLYSLGVMGYAMLAGRLPFEGPTAGDIMAQHITKEAPALKSLAPEIPIEIAIALTRCLAKDPDKRWRDATRLRRALAPAEADEVIEGFEDLATTFRMIVGAWFLLLLVAAWWLGGGDVSDPFPVLPQILGALSVFMALILAVMHAQLRKAGFESSRITREMFKPPEGWFGWYPRRFRGKEDVWERLPPQLRWARMALFWSILVSTLGAPLAVFFFAFNSHIIRTGRFPYPFTSRPDWAPRFLGLLVFAIGAAFVLTARWRKLARARGLDAKAIEKALKVATTKTSFWAQPEIAALLLPERSASHNEPSSGPATPWSLVAAVNAISSALPEPAHTLGAQAHASARHLADLIASLDKQIAGLARALDPAEAKRLVDKLSALGSDADTTDDMRDVHEILQRQLDAVRDLETRLAEAKERRFRVLGLLKSLWLHAVELQAASNDSAKTESATGRMKKLLGRIDEQDVAPKALSAQNADIHPLNDAPTLDR